MKVSHSVVITALFVCSSLISPSRAFALQENVSAAQADSIIRSTKNLVVLDVRTPEEFKLGHLENAVLIDYYGPKFYDNLEALPKGSTILVYCRSGRRSADALEILKNLRYPRVYNMLGGIDAWKKDRRKVIRSR